MPKFNGATAVRGVAVPPVTNKEGAMAYAMAPEDKLIHQVLCTFFNEGKYYGDNSAEIVANIRAVIATNPAFVANLAVYARNEMHLRSISHVLVGELAHAVNGKPFVRQAINRICERGDDPKEILAYYLATYGKPIPNSMKKGFNDVFNRMDEYGLAKYNSDGAIKMKDIVILSHPGRKDLFKRLIEGELETPVTWETELSSKGNTKEVWQELIAGRKLGYMAALRNLKNIVMSKADNLDSVLKFISDEDQVMRSKQFPYAFYNAYRFLKFKGILSKDIAAALEIAIMASMRNVKKLPGKTLIAADVSTSMKRAISDRPMRRMDADAPPPLCSAELAVLMMSMASYMCDDVITTTFDGTIRRVDMPKGKGIIENAVNVPINGGDTNISLTVRYLLDNNIKVDRIIILTDDEINKQYATGKRGETSCQELLEEYRQKVNPNCWVHAIDHMGYGTQQFKGPMVNIIAGWTEKILELLPLVESGMDTLKNRISTYYFR